MQQPSSREMQGLNSLINVSQSQMSLLHHHNHQIPNPSLDHQSSHDDFLDQMFSNLPSCSWPDLSSSSSFNPNPNDANHNNKLFVKSGDLSDDPQSVHFQFDESALLASKLRQHQISGGNSPAAKSLMLQQQLLLSRSAAGLMSPATVSGSGESGLLPMPLSLDGSQNDDVLDAGYNGFTGNLHGTSQSNQQHFHHTQAGLMGSQSYGVPPPAANQAPANGSTGTNPGQPRQRVRARRGQATDPHSIAERLRRERIAERMKALQELVPNANKTDKASMLDEIIDYVKFLQLQVKVLSMSRLGGAAAVAPLVADISSEGGGDCIQTGGGTGRSSNGTQTASSNDTITVTEHQVAKLMEEDMGSAMQYLQGKGLCLMPISLATAISTATCHSRNPLLGGADGPSSPSMSVLTVQSATMGNAVKDVTSVSKP